MWRNKRLIFLGCALPQNVYVSQLPEFICSINGGCKIGPDGSSMINPNIFCEASNGIFNIVHNGGTCIDFGPLGSMGVVHIYDATGPQVSNVIKSHNAITF